MFNSALHCQCQKLCLSFWSLRKFQESIKWHYQNLHSYYITISYVSYGLFHDTVNKVHYIVICDRMMVNSGLERIWKEAVAATFILLLWHMDELSKTMKNLNQPVSLWAKIWTHDFSYLQQECCPLYSNCGDNGTNNWELVRCSSSYFKVEFWACVLLMYWIYLLPSTQQTIGCNGFTMTCFDSHESSSGYVQNLLVLTLLLLTVLEVVGRYEVVAILSVCRMWNLSDNEY
jgi:hypothetical protein